MDFRLKDKLELNGINVEFGLLKHLNSEEIYFKALKDFFNDGDFNSFIYYIDLNLSLAMSNSTTLPNRANILGLHLLSDKLNKLRDSIRIGKVDKNLKGEIVKDFNDLKEIIDMI